MARSATSLLLFLACVALPAIGQAQTAGLGLRPMRLEMELPPGQERTMAFTIEAPTSDTPMRGRLQLTLGDWSMAEDTTVRYHEPASQANSASSWILLSAGDLSIMSGQERLVRVTARVPAGTPPGVYTSSIFVQERPPAELPKAGDQRFYFRFRYVVTVYVIVTPVSSRGELEDVVLVQGPQGKHLLQARLANFGTRHLRPLLNWFVRCGTQDVVSVKNVDASVLLPAARNTETLVFEGPLMAADCEVEVQSDFHDGRPIQAVQRSVAVAGNGSY